MANILGQYTGKSTDASNAPEALDLIRMIGSVDWKQLFAADDRACDFITDMSAKAKQYGARLQVTGRQLYYLRDLKDRLVDAGVL